MKILHVDADKLPDNCLACEFSVGSFYCRFLTPHEGIPTGCGERHPSCPLHTESEKMTKYTLEYIAQRRAEMKNEERVNNEAGWIPLQEFYELLAEIERLLKLEANSMQIVDKGKGKSNFSFEEEYDA